jgi:hypothetical protein
MGVHCGVPLHELPPSQWLVPASLEGKVGEVVGGEPKTLLCWVWPQQANDGLTREASDESLASRSPIRILGQGGRAKVRPATDSAGSV